MADRARGLTAAFSVSASQLKDLDRCERAWFLASVARAPDDANAGGQYLLQGDLFDEAVQRHQSRMDLAVEDLTAAVRAKPGLRGAALDASEEDWSRLAERAQRMLRAVERHLPAPKTARVQHRYRVLVPGYEAVGGVVVTGALDLRRPGEVWDTKSTTDRGPGRGRDAQTRPYALTDATTPGGNVNPLADDVQARLYAWCEFQEDPLRLSVRCTWVYASKPSSGQPVGWSVSHVFLRADVLAWFESYVRPRIDRMVELHVGAEFDLDSRVARANHDGCLRCFRRLSCQPFSGAQAPLKEGAVSMALDLKALRAKQAAAEPRKIHTNIVDGSATGGGRPPEPDLEAALRASLVAEAAAVAHAPEDRRADARPAGLAINRPDAPPNPAAPVVVETTGEEAPAASPPALTALGAGGAEAETSLTSAGAENPSATGGDLATAVTGGGVSEEPRRGRGRPRKARAAEPTAEAGPAPGAPGVEELEALATAAQGIADAADALVSRLNAALRARGVRL